MLTGYDAPVPVIDHPLPVFVKLIPLLLKNMQEKTTSEKCVPSHNENKCSQQDVKKKRVPVQYWESNRFKLTNG